MSSGLESQIVGDNEILGQLKSAIQFSRNLGMIGPVMDRTLNFALQAEGGLKPANWAEIADAGTDILVASCDIFTSEDPLARLTEMVRDAARIHRTSVV